MLYLCVHMARRKEHSEYIIKQNYLARWTLIVSAITLVYLFSQRSAAGLEAIFYIPALGIVNITLIIMTLSMGPTPKTTSERSMVKESRTIAWLSLVAITVLPVAILFALLALQTLFD